ncbi:MAG: hypothetical protein ABW328_03755 [Ilumatobacteraceae bacterium]
MSFEDGRRLLQLRGERRQLGDLVLGGGDLARHELPHCAVLLVGDPGAQGFDIETLRAQTSVQHR